MIASVLLVLALEMIRSAIEAVVDRVSQDRHALPKRAKNLCSAALPNALINTVAVWPRVFLALRDHCRIGLHGASTFPKRELQGAASELDVLSALSPAFEEANMNFDRLYRLGCVLLAIIIITSMLASCGRSEPEDAPSPPPVSTVLVASSALELTEDLPGRVEALRAVEVRPQVGGIVQRRLFEQGREVIAGQPLFQINPVPLVADKDTAAAALQRAEAVLSRAQVQARRLEPLVDTDAISRQVYDDAVSLRDQAAADVAQARAALARRQLDLKFATVEAPISGRIDQSLVAEGALVSSADSQPMARIQQIDKVYVDVRRSAASLDRLQQSLAQEQDTGKGLPVTILRSNGEAHAASGQILFSGITVDPGTGDVLLRIQVDNPKRRLLPGMFVHARVPIARYSDALTVPQQAVVRSDGKAFVWTIDSQNLAHLTLIELGELVDRNYRVVSGLTKGQPIAVEGMARLTDGMPVMPREHAASEPATRD